MLVIGKLEVVDRNDDGAHAKKTVGSCRDNATVTTPEWELATFLGFPEQN